VIWPSQTEASTKGKGMKAASSPAFFAELAELRSVEAQMADHLGAMAQQAVNAALSDAIAAHRGVTEDHHDRRDMPLHVMTRGPETVMTMPRYARLLTRPTNRQI